MKTLALVLILICVKASASKYYHIPESNPVSILKDKVACDLVPKLEQACIENYKDVSITSLRELSRNITDLKVTLNLVTKRATFGSRQSSLYDVSNITVNILPNVAPSGPYAEDTNATDIVVVDNGERYYGAKTLTAHGGCTQPKDSRVTCTFPIEGEKRILNLTLEFPY